MGSLASSPLGAVAREAGSSPSDAEARAASEGGWEAAADAVGDAETHAAGGGACAAAAAQYHPRGTLVVATMPAIATPAHHREAAVM